MKVHLQAFDRLNGTFELPDNFDLSTDIHLPFSKEKAEWDFTGRKMPIHEIKMKRAVFRYLGQNFADGPIFILVEVT